MVRKILGKDGRLVIPAEYRKALDMRPGDDVVLILEDGEVRLLTLRRAIQRSQEIVRRYVPVRRSLSDELIQERRKEAASEYS